MMWPFNANKPAAPARKAATPRIENSTGVYTAMGYRSRRVAVEDGRSEITASGSYHVRWDRKQLIAQSRAFMRDNPIYRGMIERACAYIVGNGFNLHPQFEDDAANKDAERLWAGYWKNPEVRGLLSGPRLELQTCRELLTCGDTALLMVADSKLQAIEAEQITASSNEDGIEFDAVGRPVKFLVAPYAATGFPDASNVKAYPRNAVLFIADPDRPSSARAVPPCQSVFSMLHRLNDVCDSEALAWQTLSRLAVTITRDYGPEMGYAESEASTVTPDVRVNTHDFGLIFHGNPGDEIRGIERNIPGQNFGQSVEMFMRLIGLPLGLPLEVTLLDWTKSNYSQSRAVLEQAFKMFSTWQSVLEDAFLRPAFIRVCKQWQASKLLPKEIDPARHSWIKPSFPWIDQLKETNAYGARIDRGFATYAQVCKSLGDDPREVADAREAEIRAAIERAKRIEEETGVAVPWQTFCGLSTAPMTPPAPEPEPVEVTMKGGVNG